MTAKERDELSRLGVQAELCAGLLDADGRQVATDMNRRMIAVDIQQLRDIPELIAVTGGATKQRAVLAVLRSGLVNSLVTDGSVARYLLDQTDSRESERSPPTEGLSHEQVRRRRLPAAVSRR